MELFTVAIGEKYEVEALRLKCSLPIYIDVFTKNNAKYSVKNEDYLINGLYHKCNFANYIDSADGPIIFMDADMFTLSENPFKDFLINQNTDFGYVPYPDTLHFPDNIRQNAFIYHGHQINSGFMYFRTLEIAKDICNHWQHEYLERVKLYESKAPNVTKYEYDEYALMIALMKLDYNVELLDKKWNDWALDSKEDILNSDSIFFQSHNHIDILTNRNL